MKRFLLSTAALVTTLVFVGNSFGQSVCCIYEQTGSDLNRVATNFCKAPANGLQCAALAYSWSPSVGNTTVGDPVPVPDDRLKTSGVGIFLEGTCDVCLETFALPVELTTFTASSVGAGEVVLNWETASEINNAGFHVEQRVGSNIWAEIGYVDGNGTTTETSIYSFRASDLDAGVHRFRLKQVDFDGTFEYTFEVEASIELPAAYVLEPAYPNPFNPSTTIRFGTDVETELTVELYDAAGKLVRTLYQGVPEVGALNSVNIDGSGLTSGTYLVKLTAADFQASQPVVLLK